LQQLEVSSGYLFGQVPYAFCFWQKILRPQIQAKIIPITVKN
jgi:hypothetical protein